MGEDPRDPRLESLLAEQVAYYRAIAPEYEQHSIPGAWEGGPLAALERFGPAGSVVELACGPGFWTSVLAGTATDVTAVDASPEMLALATGRVREANVRFLEANIFSFEPDRRFDVVFFGFWLSHVPAERFDSFWALVARCLKPDGRVFFVDDAYRTADELVYGEQSPIVRRRLNDGRAYEIVKFPHHPGDLQRRLADLGWDIAVSSGDGPFFWGAGRRQAGAGTR